MSSVYDTLFNWARKTSSSFGDIRFMPSQRDELELESNGLIYQLHHWPDLVTSDRTAAVLRTLSVMSHRAVNRRWILATSKLRPVQVDRLLQRLIQQDALIVTDISKFGPAPAHHAAPMVTTQRERAYA